MIRLPPLSSPYALLVGFSALLVLLIAASFVGLSLTGDVDRRLQTAIDEQDAKSAVLATMFRVHRDRSRLIHQLIAQQESAKAVRAVERSRALSDEFATSS